MDDKVLIISGATACGKSDLAMKIAEEKDIAIINADSLQIYEGLPILSSQPSNIDQIKVNHYLYSYLKPDQSCSVAIWLNLVNQKIEEIKEAKKIPVIVGGTGLYIAKLIDGINEIPQISLINKELAKSLFSELGKEKFAKKFLLTEKLDKQRLIRSAEVILETGKNIDFWQQQPKKRILLDNSFIHLNLNPSREIIYNNCNQRFIKMLDKGVINEVKNLNEKIPENSQIGKTIGFYEIVDFINKKISFEEMKSIITKKTRNYAKRQLTWFRHQFKEILFFSNDQEIIKFIKQL